VHSASKKGGIGLRVSRFQYNGFRARAIALVRASKPQKQSAAARHYAVAADTLDHALVFRSFRLA